MACVLGPSHARLRHERDQTYTPSCQQNISGSFTEIICEQPHFAALADTQISPVAAEQCNSQPTCTESQHSGAGKPGLDCRLEIEPPQPGHQPNSAWPNWCSNMPNALCGGQHAVKNAVSQLGNLEQAELFWVAALPRRSAGAAGHGQLAKGVPARADQALADRQLARASHAAA